MQLRVNGVTHDIEVAPEMPLLWALRDVIGLTGSKFGCGMGLCGSCTVHVDGRPARSCITPVSAAQGAEITTIEGLGANGLNSVQRAWIELNVPQCGYCQSGQIMTATTLLRDNSSPSDADIDEAMSSLICRCGTYVRIRAAIHRAAEIAAEEG